ncbi:kinase-like domain-containing protein [Xylariaceae sp. FL1272]|nr:kinase-like domain-containing protein [Xylariaceae sp. FL1272]
MEQINSATDVAATAASEASAVNTSDTSGDSCEPHSTTTPACANSVESATHEKSMTDTTNDAQVESGSPPAVSLDGVDAGADTRLDTDGVNGEGDCNTSISDGEAGGDVLILNDDENDESSAEATNDADDGGDGGDVEDAGHEDQDDTVQEYKYNYLHAEEGLEDVTRYNKGGYHPISLDDVLADRFKVVGKLGNGGFGTVWLCRDMEFEKWRAVKVMTADHSEDSTEVKIYEFLKESSSSLEEIDKNHIAVPLEYFWIEGPNGRHLCSVMEVYGGPVSDWRTDMNDFEPDTKSIVTEVCAQIVQAVAFLHRNSICHGDLRPSNILMRLDQDALNNIGLDEMEDMLGKVDSSPVWTASGREPDERAPKYLIARDCGWYEKFRIHDVVVTDFGEAFFAAESPTATGIPLGYDPPENLFSLGPGLELDLWSLGCTIYEVRTRDQLFGDLFSYSGRVEVPQVIHQQEVVLGPLPQPYLAAFDDIFRKEDEHNFFTDATVNKRAGRDENEPTAIFTIDFLRDERLEMTKDSGYDDVLQAMLGVERGQILRFIGLEPEAWEATEDLKYHYSRDEVINIADTIHSLVKWHPSEREAAKNILQQDWLVDTVAAKENRAIASRVTTPTPDFTELLSSQIAPKRYFSWRLLHREEKIEECLEKENKKSDDFNVVWGEAEGGGFMVIGDGKPHDDDVWKRITTMRRKGNCIGKGTRDEPMVMWLSVPPPHGRVELDNLIKQQAYNMGQAYAWVMMGVHNTTTVQKTKVQVQDGNTVKEKTLRTMAQDDDHVTVRFGPSIDKCTVHGHLYIHMVDKRIGNQTARVATGRLMTEDERSYVGGRPRHLWIYGKYRPKCPAWPRANFVLPEPPFTKKKDR